MLFLQYPWKFHVLSSSLTAVWTFSRIVHFSNDSKDELREHPNKKDWLLHTAVLAGKWTFFDKKTYYKIKKDSYLSQNRWYFDKITSFRKLMICFCYFRQKKIIFQFGCDPCWPLCKCKWGSEKQFLEVLPNFFQNYWIATKTIKVNWIP